MKHIQIKNHEITRIQAVTSGVSQESILAPLLFLLYIYDLKSASDLLHPIMFADDTNLFYSS